MQDYMAEALHLAQKGRGTSAPNPMVGCVIVRDGQVVGRGWHERAGEPHAEVFALREAQERARGATAYVTLEPCNHVGRTPACSESLIAAGISEVHVAMVDPNPIVAGRGIERLRATGIRVYVGTHEAEARRLNEVFIHYITTRRPFVIAKWAMTIDGRIATHTGHSRWVTGAAARAHVHRTRHDVSAILVGRGTALADNPRLTTRLAENKPNGPHPPSPPPPILREGGEEHPEGAFSPPSLSIGGGGWPRRWGPRHPLRVVLDSRGTLPTTLRLFDSALPGQTLVATTEQASSAWLNKLDQQGVELLVLTPNSKGRVPLLPLLHELGRRQLSSLLVEGGAEVHASFFAQGMVNKVHAYIAPKLVGGRNAPAPLGGDGVMTMDQATQLAWQRVEPLGDDLLLVADVKNS